ncbi:GGDEF domain-containing protein [Fundidesulfovibrio putealis]|uniref:GGDEF domain-containing protein n=1 Tax=Fundidesulfovibrio putealis TaxID=270496 RepID=UPI0004124773|nr:GGDEF domain-containing protein [Fundidesulfovibrio putealis]
MIETTWFKTIESNVAESHDYLISNDEFYEMCTSILQDTNCPLDGFICEINTSGFPVIVSGSPGDGESKSSKNVPLGVGGRTSCTIKLWPKNEIEPEILSEVLDECTNELLKLVKAFWKPDLRDDKSNLPSLHMPQAKSFLNKTISRYLHKELAVAFFYIDLDKFKEINDKYGHAVGDILIYHMSGLIAHAAERNGIALHVGGDEYSFLLPIKHADESLLVAYELYRSAKDSPFFEQSTGDNIQLSFSIGIAICSNINSFRDHVVLYTVAEKAVKSNGNKIRGTARISSSSSDSLMENANNVHSRDVAFAVSKSQILSLRPFHSPWLNVVSQIVAKNVLSWKRIDKSLTGLILDINAWVKPEFVDTHLCAYADSDQQHFKPQMSKFDFLVAIAHGLFRAYVGDSSFITSGSELIVHYNDTWSSVALSLEPDKIDIFQVDPVSGMDHSFKLGSFWTCNGECSSGDVNGAIAILIKVVIDRPNGATHVRP